MGRYERRGKEGRKPGEERGRKRKKGKVGEKKSEHQRNKENSQPQTNNNWGVITVITGKWGHENGCQQCTVVN